MASIRSSKLNVIITAHIIFTIYLILIPPVNSKNQYVLPLNMGMKVSIPYDIANILHRPNPFQGGLAIFLSFCLLAILFFGVITSPFGYMFGIPSQKYVLGDLKTVYKQVHDEDAATSTEATKRVSDIINQIETFQQWIDDADDEIEASPRNLPVSDSLIDLSLFNELWTKLSGKLKLDQLHEALSSLKLKKELIKDQAWKLFVNLSKRSLNTDFVQSMFYWMPQSDPQVMSEGCQLLTLCYAHGTIKLMPFWMIQVYHVFSQKMTTLPKSHKQAILLGFQDNSYTICPKVYGEKCSENLFTLVLKSFLQLLSESVKSPTTPKRKQAMYM